MSSDLIERHVSEVIVPLTEFYLDLHQHPELSGAEVRTSVALADRLAADGFKVTTNIGGYGVLGVLRNGSGPAVMLRAELDALPIEERTGLPYASIATAGTATAGTDGGPVMHACGHDAHLACVAGAATVLARCLDTWSGTVMVIGQPAEETLTGARAMLADGLYRHAGTPDVVLAQHVAPLPTGLVAHADGVVTAGSIALDIVVHGRGGHAGTPHLAVNPIQVAAAIVHELGNPGVIPDVVVCVGAVHAGTRNNIIPDTATISVSLRSLDSRALTRGALAVCRRAAERAAAAGCPRAPQVSLASRAPVGVNDPDAAAVVRAAHTRVLGAGRVMPCPPLMATEDFPLYGPAGRTLPGGAPVPTVYWWIGSIGPRRWLATPGDTAAAKVGALPPNHSSEFAPDPVPTLRTGITTMVAAALGFLTRG